MQSDKPVTAEVDVAFRAKEDNQPTTGVEAAKTTTLVLKKHRLLNINLNACLTIIKTRIPQQPSQDIPGSKLIC